MPKNDNLVKVQCNVLRIMSFHFVKIMSLKLKFKFADFLDLNFYQWQILRVMVTRGSED